MDILKWIKGMHIERFFQHVLGLTPEDQKFTDDAVKKAVYFVDKIKNFVNSPTVDVATNWFPGDWDNKAVAAGRDALNTILDGMLEGQECSSKPTLEEKLLCAVEKVVPQGNSRAKFWHDLASDLARIFSDGKLTLSDGFILVEIAFRELLSKKFKAAA